MGQIHDRHDMDIGLLLHCSQRQQARHPAEFVGARDAVIQTTIASCEAQGVEARHVPSFGLTDPCDPDGLSQLSQSQTL